MSWTKETGTRVDPTKAVSPKRSSLRLSHGDPLSLSVTGEAITPSKTRTTHDSFPRGTRASTFHEKMVVSDPPKDSELKDTVEIMKALGKARPSKSPSGTRSTATPSALRTTNGNTGSEHRRASSPPSGGAVKIKTAPRSDPSVGYLAMLWAATGRGLSSAIPELPHAPEPSESQVGRIHDDYTGWVAGRGDVTFARSEVQILDGITKHRRRQSGFVR
jgi:hypothetical protein